jgi:hypothetical protein
MGRAGGGEVMPLRDSFYSLIKNLPPELQPRFTELLQSMVFRDELVKLPVTPAASVTGLTGVVAITDQNSKIIGYSPVYSSHG